MKALNKVLTVTIVVAAGGTAMAADYPCRTTRVGVTPVGVAQVTPRYSYRSGYTSVAQPVMTTAPQSMWPGGRPVYEADANWEFVRNRARIRGW